MWGRGFQCGGSDCWGTGIDDSGLARNLQDRVERVRTLVAGVGPYDDCPETER
jgi:hypothetical protein